MRKFINQQFYNASLQKIRCAKLAKIFLHQVYKMARAVLLIRLGLKKAACDAYSGAHTKRLEKLEKERR